MYYSAQRTLTENYAAKIIQRIDNYKF
jgi:hypothetical protein